MKIIVDSACDVNEELCKNRDLNLEFVPFSLMLDDKHIIDDETFEINAYIEKMAAAKTVKTAAPSPELFLEKMKGLEACFGVCISSPLSASYNNALLAKQMFIDEYGEKLIHIFDSHSASIGLTLIAIKINEFIKQNLPGEEIVEKVNQFKDSMKTYFVLDKYDNLVRNGRINGYVAKAASILNIKPVCAEVEGKLAMVDKARGTNRALTKVIDLIEKDKADFENRSLAIGHVRCLEKALWFKNEVLKRINIKDIIIVETAGLCTTYADDGGLIIAF